MLLSARKMGIEFVLQHDLTGYRNKAVQYRRLSKWRSPSACQVSNEFHGSIWRNAFWRLETITTEDCWTCIVPNMVIFRRVTEHIGKSDVLLEIIKKMKVR